MTIFFEFEEGQNLFEGTPEPETVEGDIPKPVTETDKRVVGEVAVAATLQAMKDKYKNTRKHGQDSLAA